MLAEKKQLLVVDDEPNLRRVLAAQLSRDGYEVHTAEDGEQGLQVLADNHIDLVITDLRMPKLDGMELLKHALALEPDLPIVMLTAHGTVDNAVEALKSGAFDYITKPFDQDEVRTIVRKALKTSALSSVAARRVQRSAGEQTRFGIIGTSNAAKELVAVLERVADTPATVLLTGETGTGKELVARALHEHSSRKTRPFIKVNCAAIPPELVEAELFGVEQGMHKGTQAPKPGRFELAAGGSLFLDEIATLSLEVQVRLLRALQENSFERVGGVKAYPLNVRLIAASHQDLREEVRRGTFREDLFYRLNVVPISLVPLRKRREDILPQAEHFAARSNARLNKRISGIAEDAVHLLQRYPWPGNIRELENVIERAVLFCDGEVLSADDLPPELREANQPPELSASTATSGEGLKQQVKAAMNRLERELIQRALQQTSGNVTHAARLLKISRKGLQLKMKELDLRERDDRPSEI